MQCPNCKTNAAPGAGPCSGCGRPMPVYGIPDGFHYHKESGLYLRRTPAKDKNGAEIIWLTWFDAVAGSYTQERTPPAPGAFVSPCAENGETHILQPSKAPSAPKAQPAPKAGDMPAAPEQTKLSALPEPTLPQSPPAKEPNSSKPPAKDGGESLPGTGAEPSSTPKPATVTGEYEPPKGFLFHEQSGLYYKAQPGKDESGAPIEWITWFDNKTGEYAQVGYPLEKGGASPYLAPFAEPKEPVKKKRFWFIPLFAVLLLAALGFCTWYFKWYTFLLAFSQAPVAEPEQQSVVDVPSESLPEIPPSSAPPFSSEEPVSEEPAPPVPVIFENPGLEQAVRDYLQKPAGDIFPDELAEITSISAMGSTIGINTQLQWDASTNGNLRNLADFINFPELQSLDLINQGITDLSPLAGQTSLQNLYLDYNYISDLSPLEELSQLRELSAPHNKVEDLAPIGSLGSLIYLDLSYNNIEDISPLANLEKLESLYLEVNKIRDISPLAQLSKLAVADLAENRILDWQPVSHIPDTAGRGVVYLEAYFGNSQLIDDLADYFALSFGEVTGESEAFPDFTENSLDYYLIDSLDITYIAFSSAGGQPGQQGSGVRAILTTTVEIHNQTSLLKTDLEELFGSRIRQEAATRGSANATDMVATLPGGYTFRYYGEADGNYQRVLITKAAA